MSRIFFVEQRTASLSVNVAESLDFIPHLHSQIELVLARRGEGTVTIEGVSHVMHPGEAALCWPNRVHSYSALPGGSLYYMAIFDTALLGRTGEAFARTDCAMPFLAAQDVHPDVELALGRMIGEPDMPAALRRAFAIIAVERLLAALDVVPREHAADPDALHRTLAYIEANLSGEISLDGMARALFLNKYYISKLLSERVGCNLHTYLNALRINRAQGLLSDPALSLEDVMARCGYASERTFYRAFRAHTGLTPRQYREGISQ